jgi:hypothetical protein
MLRFADVAPVDPRGEIRVRAVRGIRGRPGVEDRREVLVAVDAVAVLRVTARLELAGLVPVPKCPRRNAEILRRLADR